ncbi:MFS transporter [Psychrobacillus lasiicapitis]|uniref:MFS transporter n=1 Tax=Psychrobacillus lasiicapitis TaxID=1636719 RepID=A0A544T5F4_9BACI|nr:MFS transporter [Psychrobacillus lasiicapitis]TQR12646.1 MFS transporter [Psychrobacillus lasiicapitis]GGA39802.1 MFS transporter [Psychrobacillus lasiicapitis]
MRSFVYLIIFFSFFDLFTQLPIMSPYANKLGATPFITGLVVGMYSFANTIGNVISGVLTDKKGPYYVLLFGLFATSGALFLYHLVTEPIGLLFIRFIHGLVAGFIVPAAFTFSANQTASDKRGKGVALSGAFVGLAAIVGPAMSGIIASKKSEVFVLSITASIMLLLSVLSVVLLKSITIRRQTTITKSTSTISIRQFFQEAGLVKAFAGAFFLMFSQGVLAYMLPLKILHLGFDTKTSGLLLSIFGFVAILIFIMPTNRIFDQVKPVKTLAFGMALMGTSMLLLGQTEILLFMYMWMGLYGVGFAFLFPSINSLLIDSTHSSNRGKAYGYFYAFFSIGVVAGSSVTGYLELTANDGFFLTGIVLLITSSLSILISKK